MNRSTHLTRLLGTTVLATVIGAAFAGQALAQSAPPVVTDSGRPVTKPGADQNALEEVVVTGTRIRSANLVANNPVQVVDSKEIALSGVTDISTLLQRQPQVGISNNTVTTNNTVRATGLENINLRGLGATRTLTLVDGHRQVGGSASTTAVDIGTISPTIIDRVDIVTGGSSALYGADAVAGVVNFILKRDLEGVNYEFQYGAAYHGGDINELASISVGHNFDHNRGNVSLSVDYNNQTPIYQYQRDYATTGLAGIPNTARSTTVANVPNTIAATGIRSNTLGSSAETGNSNLVTPSIITNLAGAPGLSLTFNAAGTAIVPLNRGSVLLSNTGAVQTSSANCPTCYLATIDTLDAGLNREGLTTSARYELIQDRGWLRSAEVYGSFKYFHDNGFGTSSQGTFAQGGLGATTFALEPSNKVSAGLPGAAQPYPVRTDNAYIPAALAALIAATPRSSLATLNGAPAILINRIDNDFGNREQKVYYDSGEAVLGFRGAFKNDWHFDTFVNYGQTTDTSINFDRLEQSFFNQIDAVKNPANGQIVCRVTLSNPSSGCLPLNIFALTGNSQAALQQSYIHTIEHDTVNLLNYQANLNGDLFHYPTLFSHTDVPVGFALGFEYRRESSDQEPDKLVQTGAVFGNFTPVTKGHYDTKEIYGELNVPVLANMPFVKRLEFDLSGRAQDFSTTGFDGTYGLSGNWAISDDFKLRGVYSKAVRAPNINELFANGAVSFNAVTDPCDATQVNQGTQPANRLANCVIALRAAGVDPLNQPGHVGTYTFTQTTTTKQNATLGNPNLDPERATTYTGGLVWTPHFLRGFNLTLDYYNIKIKGAIGALSLAQIVNNCVDSPSLANSFCPQVTRTADGNVGSVVTSVFNVASFRAKGEDLAVNYTFALSDLRFLPDWGRLTLHASANHADDLLQQAVAGDDTTRSQFAGALTSGQPTPRFKGETRVTWDFRNYTVSYATQIISSINLSNSDAPLQFSYERVPGYISHDIRFEYRFKGQTAYIGINNFTDEDPPYVPGVFTGTGVAGSLYGGPVGRFIYVGLSGHF